MGVWRGMLAGGLGGVIAAGTMTVVYKSLAAILSRTRQPAPIAEQQHDEDATVKVADGIARRLVRRPLSEDKKSVASNLVHYAFGAGVGAIYGAVAAVAPRVTVALGLPFGVAVWLGAHVIVVPALGLAAPPTRQPAPKEAGEFGLHLVYGAVTELVRRFFRRPR